MTARITREVEVLLCDAHTIARRRKHAAVLPEHLLAAMTAGNVWRHALAPVARPELVRLVERRLTQLPEVGGYRDRASAIPLAPETRALLAPRWSLLPQTIDVRWVLARMGERPEIVRLFEEATLDLGAVEPAIDVARARAGEARHVAVRLEHVLRVLADTAWLDVALRTVGSSAAALGDALDRRIGTFVARRTGDPHIADTVLRAVLHTKFVVAPRARRGPTSDQFVAVALEDADLRGFLHDANIPVADLWSLLVDGKTNDGSAGACSVVFHNDDATTQEFVVHVLETIFGLPPERARMAMLRVHERGEAVVAALPQSEAERRVEHATTAARAAGFPLVISIRCAT